MRLSVLFHHSTRNEKIPFEAGEIPPEWKKTYYKKYPRLFRFVLPEPRSVAMPLYEALMARKSGRDFDAGKSVSLREISDFLHWSAGIKNESAGAGKRMYPSGGGRYPIEIYPVVFRGGDFDKGIYHYAPLEHALEKIADESWLVDAREALVDEKMKNADAVFIMAAVFERTMMKYQEFGYRLILEEAGHICQNFYLVAAAMGLAGCGLGGFYDRLANELLDIDGVSEAAVYAFAMGHEK